MKRLQTGKAFKWANAFFLQESKFKRLRKDFDLSTYEQDFARNVPEFKRTLRTNFTSSLKDDLIKGTDYFVTAFAGLSDSSRQIVETLIDAKVVSANHRTQITNFILSAVMVVLSVLMLFVGLATITSKPKICESPLFSTSCERINHLFLGK